MSDPLIFRQGVDTAMGWEITAPDESPITDLDALTAKCQVRKWEAPDAPILADLQTSIVTIDDAVVILIEYTAEESLLWKDWPETAAFDVIAHRNGRPIDVIDQGIAILDKVVTHG